MIDELKPYPVAIGYNWPIDDIPTTMAMYIDIPKQRIAR